jgi:hypothetical protein
MKKFSFLLILIFPISGFSQGKKSIDGFLDMPFGSDSATVKKLLLSKNSTRVDSLSGKDLIMFSGFDFSGRNILGCSANFVHNKAYEYDVFFYDFMESDILKYYDQLSADLTAVYGKGELQANFGDSNNSGRIRRLKSGNASCRTLWQSKNKNILNLEIHSNNGFLEIILHYESADLWALKIKERQSDL